MRLPTGSDQLVFLHIPKTAGTAFTRYLQGQWPKNAVSPDFVGDYDALRTEDTSVKLFCGHMYHSEMRRRLPRAHVITFLREPFTRAFSQWKSWSDPKNFPKDDPWRAVMSADQIADIELAQTLSFDEFILAGRPRFDLELTNVQTLMLSDAEPGVSALSGFIESAKTNLNNTLFFGIVEYFAESIAMLRKVIPDLEGYDIPTALENRGRDLRMDLSSKARLRLNALLAEDRQLYAHAVDMFRQRQRTHWFFSALA